MLPPTQIFFKKLIRLKIKSISIGTKNAINPIQSIIENLGVSNSKISRCSHHISHAFAALPLLDEKYHKDFTGITIDGVGTQGDLQAVVTSVGSIDTVNILNSGSDILQILVLF